MNNILIVQLARLGDILQTKRLVLSAFQEEHSQVYLLVDTSLARFTKMLYPQAIVHSIPASAASNSTLESILVDAASVLQQLAAIHFSAVYTLNASPLSYALARFFPPEVVFGYSVVNGQTQRSLWCKIGSRMSIHRGTSPLNLFDFWGYFHPNPIAPALVNPIAKRAGTGRIGVVLAGQEARRSLPPAILASCLRAVFQAQNEPTIVCLGTQAERKVLRQLKDFLPVSILHKLEDMTGKTTLTDLPEIFAQFDMLLTPDTGLMHLAAHYGVPVQAFFLSSAWCFETGPYGLGHKVWQSVQDCSPCLEVEACLQKTKCLEPFLHKKFLVHLSGKFDEEWPTGMNGYVSALDALGGTYRLVDGVDVYAETRSAHRDIIAEKHGLITASVPSLAAENVYKERDWMLPSTRVK